MCHIYAYYIHLSVETRQISIYTQNSAVGNGSRSNGVFTLAVSGTGTGTGTGTYIIQKPFTLAVSGARTEHLKAIEISLEHTT